MRRISHNSSKQFTHTYIHSYLGQYYYRYVIRNMASLDRHCEVQVTALE